MWLKTSLLYSAVSALLDCEELAFNFEFRWALYADIRPDICSIFACGIGRINFMSVRIVIDNSFSL